MRTAIAGVTLSVGLVIAGMSSAEEQNGVGFSQAQTQRAVSTFNDGAKGCMGAPVAYRVDCFQQVFGQTARVISKASAYWEAEVALTRVNRNLYTFVRNHTDKNAGRERVNGARVKAVTKESLPEARAVFEKSIDQAVVILQGSTASETKYFAPIAEAVSSVRDALK